MAIDWEEKRKKAKKHDAEQQKARATKPEARAVPDVTPLFAALANREPRPDIALPRYDYAPIHAPASPALPKLAPNAAMKKLGIAPSGDSFKPSFDLMQAVAEGKIKPPVEDANKDSEAEIMMRKLGGAIAGENPDTLLGGLRYNAARGLQGLGGAVEGGLDFLVGGINSLGSTISSGFGTNPNPVSKWFDEGAKYVLDNDITGAFGSGIEAAAGDKLPQLTRLGGDIYQGAGQIAANLFGGKMLSGTGKLSMPSASKALIGASAAGGGAQQAFNEGASVKDAISYGNVAGALEATIESLAGGIPGMGKGLTGKMFEALNKTPAAIKAIADILGEGGEEVLSDVITPYIQRAMYNPSAENASFEQMARDFVTGAALSGVMTGANALGNGRKAKVASTTASETLDAPSAVAQDVAPDVLKTPVTAVEGAGDVGTPVEVKTAQGGFEGGVVATNLQANISEIKNEPLGAVEEKKAATERLPSTRAAERAAKEIDGIIENALSKSKNGRANVSDIVNLIGDGYNTSKYKSGYNQAYDAIFDKDRYAVDAENNIYKVDAEEHIDRRDPYEVGKRSLKSFQYQHPELHKYFKEAAQSVYDDLSATIPAERGASKISSNIYDPEVSSHGGYRFWGYSRATSPEIAQLKDDFGMSYADVEKAVKAIIEDSGQENYAAAKKLETILDDMLTHGYKPLETAKVGPNVEYIKAKNSLYGANEELNEKLIHEYSLVEGTKEWQEFYDQKGRDLVEALEPHERLNDFQNMPNGTGAAEAGFDPFSHLQNQKGEFHKTGEEPTRIVEVPTTDEQGRNISKGVQTALEAGATPDAAVDKIQNSIAEGKFSYLPVTDDAAKGRAEETIRHKGFETALKDWTADTRGGKVSKDLLVLGQTLYNNALNSGHTKEGVDILVDLVKMSRTGAQTTQANRVLKQLSPDYQLYALQRSVMKLNDEQSEKLRGGHRGALKNVSQHEYDLLLQSREDALNLIREINENFASKDHGVKVENWATEMGKKLADNLKGRYDAKVTKPEPITRTIVKDLVKFAEEHALPKKQAEKSSRSAADRITDYFNNRDKYAEAWNAAKDVLREKYEGNPNALDAFEEFLQGTISYNAEGTDAVMLTAVSDAALSEDLSIKSIMLRYKYGDGDAVVNKIFEKLNSQVQAQGADEIALKNAVERFVAQSGDSLSTSEILGKDIKSALSEIGVKMSEIIKSGATSKADVAKRISNMLVTQYGFESNNSQLISEEIVNQFTAQVYENAQKKLESKFEPNSITAKSGAQHFTELLNMGAFSSDRFNQLASEKVFGYKNIKLDSTLSEEFLSAATEAERNAAFEKIKDNIASQVPSTWHDKWNAWRYLAMLGNPKTHVRNFFGNAGFVPVRMVKNAIAIGLENVSGVENRTKAVLSIKDAPLIKAAFADYDAVSKQIMSLGKFDNFAGDIESRRTIFKGKNGTNIFWKFLEGTKTVNSKALDFGDVVFAKTTFATSLAGFYKAKGISAEQLASGAVPLETIDSARAYAIREAQRATYRDSNAFSDFVAKLGKRHSDNPVSKIANVLVEGVLPFKRTPANILTRAVEYSPAGLLKGLTSDLIKVHRGDMDAATAIDNISAGLTGSGILAFGAFFASMGLISGGRSDDDKEAALDDLTGFQGYALNVGGKSITLDWLAPEALPFFVGVELFNAASDKSEEGMTLSKALDKLSGIAEPMLEMSMLQGVQDMLDSVKYSDGNSLVSIGATSAVNYLSQGLPTLFGQAERIVETERETTYIDDTSGIPASIQRMLGKTANKIPFVEYNQTPYVDAFGRHQDSGSLGKKIFDNALNPAYVNNKNSDAVTDELYRLNDAKRLGRVPDKPKRKFSYDGKEYILTEEEYTKFSETSGAMTHKLMQTMLDKKAYDKADDEGKAKMLSDIIGYANDAAKREYVEGIGKAYSSADYQKAYDAYNAGISVPDYYSFKNTLNGIKASDSPTQLEAAKAALDTELENGYKGKLWDLQNKQWAGGDKNPFTGALAKTGIPPKVSIGIMEKYKELENTEFEGSSSQQKRQRATELEMYISDLGLAPEQAEIAKEVYRYWGSYPVKAYK